MDGIANSDGVRRRKQRLEGDCVLPFQRLMKLLGRSLELSESERSIFLDSLDPEDQPLRDELAQLLAAKDEYPEILATRGPARILGGLSFEAPALDSGQQLGPYEILENVGAGGMGRIYRARDTRLKRVVAIKVISPSLMKNPEYQRRFEREARAISRLSHPNICVLHDVGQDGGLHYLVMEYLTGQSLGQRLKQGALSLEDLLEIAIPVAAALEAAHRLHIVHRDLKPDNIMITPSGVKLLDFGIAKVVHNREDPGAPRDSSSLASESLTSEDSLLGTIPYMAPEQLRGDEVDHRCDLFSLGAVIYEMASGHRAFRGAGPSLVATIVSGEVPPLSDLMSEFSPDLAELAKACLEKDPEERIQTAHEVRQRLEWTRDQIKGVRSASAARPRFGRRRGRHLMRWFRTERVASILVASAVVGIAVGSVATLRQRGARDHESGRLPRTSFEVGPPTGSRTMNTPRLAPDGSTLAFLAADSLGVSRVWLRPLMHVTSQAQIGTEGARGLFWAPDSRSLGFFARDMIQVLDTQTGGIRSLAALPPSSRGHWDHEAAWTEDGRIIFDYATNDSLHWIPEEGGVPAPLTHLNPAAGEVGHCRPTILGDRLTYLVEKNLGRRLLTVESPGGERRELGRSHSRGRLTPSSHLLWVHLGVLYAQALDLNDFRFHGSPQPIADGILSRRQTGNEFTISNNGVLAYQSGRIEGLELVRLDRQGRPIERLTEPGRYRFPSFAPGKRHVAIAKQDLDNNRDIWILDLESGGRHRLTVNPRNDNVPIWTPDGQSITYLTSNAERTLILRRSVHGGGAVDTLLTSASLGGDSLMPECWYPDGRGLLCTRFNAENGSSLFFMAADSKEGGNAPALPWMSTSECRLSPDGRWFAFESDQAGRAEIYVQRSADGSGLRQLSEGGGSLPRWREDGRELFFLSAGLDLMSIAVSENNDDLFDRPERLFDPQLPELRFERSLLVGPRGESFLFLRRPIEQATRPITVVLNWEAALSSP